VGLNTSGKAFLPTSVIAVDIALSNSNFTRFSVQTDLDTAESVADALALSTKLPTRVTIDGAVFKVFTRGGG